MQIIENMYDLRPGWVQIGFHKNLRFEIHETSSKTGQEVYDLVPDYKLKSTHISLTHSLIKCFDSAPGMNQLRLR